jgi:hypothetical protein
MKITPIVLVSLTLSLTAPVYGAEPIIYPAQKQSPEQQDKDTYECYGWAKQQTGFDPMAAPTTQTPPPVEQQGPKRGRAVAGGAVVGGLIGATQGEAGKGAAIGGGAGAVGGGVRQRNIARQNQQRHQVWEEQEAAQYQQSRDDYNRAFAACMEGRGYSVK